MTAHLLETRSLTRTFTVKRGLFSRSKEIVNAVDGIDLTIQKGETFGLVGESGCGKSTTGKMLVRLLKPTSGTIRFKGEDLTAKTEKQMLPMRRNLQMIFQNPYGSLDPKMTLRQILEEPLRIHKQLAENRRRRVRELLAYVGLPTAFLDRTPSEFSGGQRQRIAIARALALSPEFIVADEPVSALDVSIQAQILNLLTDLQKALSLTCLFISHDLSVVEYVSDRAGVMYLGKIVEMADCRRLYARPSHPYTRMLLASVPVADPGKPFRMISDEPAELHAAPPEGGCRFFPRCAERMEICRQQAPALKEIAPGHQVACHGTAGFEGSRIQGFE